MDLSFVPAICLLLLTTSLIINFRLQDEFVADLNKNRYISYSRDIDSLSYIEFTQSVSYRNGYISNLSTIIRTCPDHMNRGDVIMYYYDDLNSYTRDIINLHEQPHNSHTIGIFDNSGTMISYAIVGDIFKIQNNHYASMAIYNLQNELLFYIRGGNRTINYIYNYNQTIVGKVIKINNIQWSIEKMNGQFFNIDWISMIYSRNLIKEMGIDECNESYEVIKCRLMIGILLSIIGILCLLKYEKKHKRR